MSMCNKRSFLSILALVVLTLPGCNQNQAHVHSYDFNNPVWAWESIESGYIVQATLTCSGCKETDKGHVLILDATVSQEAINPTCENDGSITYTATITYKGKTITDQKTDSIQKLGHYFETITVEGDYKKAYLPLESFDSSNLVVKATCSRQGCGKVVTLSKDEYFIAYQTQGADHLCAGDTKVTISSSYAPFATYELTGLTVDYLDNSISGMEASYETTCHHTPDLSGISCSSVPRPSSRPPRRCATG